MDSARIAGFCRDCLADLAVPLRRCPGCGSPRLLVHPEIGTLTIAHIDCDAFYASVEKRDRPELQDVPLIVGGGRRGVVTTACYIARIKGVRSAMPMFKALELCPEAAIIKPDMAKYAELGRQIRAAMERITPLVQPVSIDEAFLDLGGTERLHRAPAAKVLARLQQEIRETFGVTVSVGLSHNKFLAKIASDLHKPHGFSVIGRQETTTFLAQQPIALIFGIGEVTQERLAKTGLRTIGQIQAMPREQLARQFGSVGERLHLLSHGIDERPVSPRGGTKSISSETTFDEDIRERDRLVAILRRLSEKVGARLKASEYSGQTVVLKLKSADFRIRTRNRRLRTPTRLADRLFEAGRELLEREIDGTAFRLIGIGCTDLGPAVEADPTDLGDPDAEKRARAEAARDRIRARFGASALELGYTYGTGERLRREPR